MAEVFAQNYINGEFESWSGGYVDSVDPSTGAVWARIPDSGPEDVDRAVRSAQDAFPGYATLNSHVSPQICHLWKNVVIF
jgi:acyl-CoA reductase-like NAD-dependent aldehyde dehydrogenase